MKKKRLFAAYRYTAVPVSQLSLFDAVEEQRLAAISAFFQKAAQFRKLRYDLSGATCLLVWQQQIAGNVFLFQFARESRRTQHAESDSGIAQVRGTEYPFVRLVIDRERQLILAERNTGVFRRMASLRTQLQACLQQEFAPSGFEISLEGIADEDSFWAYAHHPIHQLTLMFTAAGEADDSFAGQLQARYGCTRAEIRLSSPDEPLTGITPENRALAEAVNRASCGGMWKVVYQTGQGRKAASNETSLRELELLLRDNGELDMGERTAILDGLDQAEALYRRRCPSCTSSPRPIPPPEPDDEGFDR